MTIRQRLRALERRIAEPERLEQFRQKRERASLRTLQRVEGLCPRDQKTSIQHYREIPTHACRP